MSEAPRAWHAMAPEEALEALGSSPGGLAPAESARRLATVGPNELAETKRVTALALLAEQFRNVLVR